MNTSKASSGKADEKIKPESWPRKLNKALIAVGLIAFGLIVTDRLLEAFNADDAPDVASRDGSTMEGTDDTSSNVFSEAAKIDPDKLESMAELQELIGSRVIFISMTDQGYLVTEDERRIAVDDDIAEASVLAGVTTHQVIVDTSGGLKVFALPDPIVQ